MSVVAVVLQGVGAAVTAVVDTVDWLFGLTLGPGVGEVA